MFATRSAGVLPCSQTLVCSLLYMYPLVIMLVGFDSVAGRLGGGFWGALAGLSCVADPREKRDPETRGIQD